MAEHDERDEIARRAYQRYEERGRADGNDQDDWFEAERELRDRRPSSGIGQSSGDMMGSGEAPGRGPSPRE
jgi:hypothetical protein